ncbi:MAG: oligoribonuclease [Microcoleus sp.]
MTKRAKLLWLDLEMTGLDDNHDRILEVAAIATDWNFKELGTYDVVVHQSDATLKTMNEWCVAQHGASGLTERVRASKISDKAAEAGLLKFIDEHFSAAKPVLLAGNSIHMDRRFIVSYWPELDARLHYRMLDVSAWKLVFEGKYRSKFSKPEEHRALSDIRGSILELQHYIGKLKNH